MARINNDNQENINNIKNQVELYYNNISIPYFSIQFDDFDTENFEIEEYDELQNRIQDIQGCRDYLDFKNIYVEYNYDTGIQLIGYIKGGEE